MGSVSVCSFLCFQPCITVPTGWSASHHIYLQAGPDAAKTFCGLKDADTDANSLKEFARWVGRDPMEALTRFDRVEQIYNVDLHQMPPCNALPTVPTLPGTMGSTRTRQSECARGE